MICPNCKTELQDNAKFCKNCGEKLSTSNSHEEQIDYSNTYSSATNDYSIDHEEQFNYSNTYSSTTDDYSVDHGEQFDYSELYSNMLKPTITSDEDYIKSYVGNSYEIIKEEKLSVPALIFGPIYLLYRKMWLFALTIIFINYILLVYCNQELTITIQLLIHIYLGFKFNNLYMQNTIKKIDEIKMSNPDKSSTELLDVCKKQGGVSTNYIIIGIIATIIGWEIAAYQNSGQQYTQEKTNEPMITIADMNYQIDKKITNSNNTDNYHYYSYINDENYCSFSISTDNYIKMYSNANDYLKKTISATNKNTEITFEQKIINNITWDFAQVSGDYKKENNYAILKNNMLYIIRINHYRNTTNDCTEIENELLESISFNK